MIRAILFDMFGTLVVGSASRTELGYYGTHDRLRAAGVDIPYDEFLQSWSRVMNGLDDWSARTQQEYPMERLVRDVLTALGTVATPALTRELMLSYLRERFVGLRAIPGVPELTAELAARFRLGVISNTHYAPLVHEQLVSVGIRQHFHVVVTSDEHGWRKPHASIFDVALARMEIPADQAIFVGDSYDADYLGAVNAGLQALLIDPTGSQPIPERHRIRSVLEIQGHPALGAGATGTK
jgi:putative hydrolase of the HAD superfamily